MGDIKVTQDHLARAFSVDRPALAARVVNPFNRLRTITIRGGRYAQDLGRDAIPYRRARPRRQYQLRERRVR